MARKPPASTAYSADLAFVHHDGFAGYARGVAPDILRRLQARGIRDGLVIDLGCGSGVWAAELLAAGYDVLGIDISLAMVRLARSTAPAGRFRVASALDARLPRCRAVTALGEVVNYLFDTRNGLGALGRLFARVHAALEPGGLFVLDTAEPGRGAAARPSHVTGRDWAVLLDQRVRGSLLERDIVTFRRIGRAWRRTEERHRLRLIPSDQLCALLRAAGFRVRKLRRFGDFTLPPGLAGFVAGRS